VKIQSLTEAEADLLLSPATTSDSTFVELDDYITDIETDAAARAASDVVIAQMTAAKLEHLTGLRELRASFSLTQVDLARALGVTQGSVAQAEGRDDLLLSTLQRYVEAITGGELRLVVVTKGRQPIEFSISELASA
jgi:DNA-binding XRE family transcriptional regulator